MRTEGNKARIAAAVFLGILCVLTIRSWADEEHYNNILIGERAAGLGGAYTAVSDDPAGLYHNPAGIVFAKGTNLSGSMNAFYFSQKHYDGVLGGQGWNRRSSRLLPNFFGVIQQAPVGMLGFSYAVPDAVKENQDQVFDNLPCQEPSIIDPNRNAFIESYLINLYNEDNTYNFGPSYGLEVSDTLTCGITLYFHNRRIERLFNQLCILEDGDDRYEWSHLSYELQEWGVRPVIGIMWSPKDTKLSLGLTLSHTFLFDSEIRSQNIYKGLDYDANAIEVYNRKLAAKRYYPYVATLGVAYFPSPSFLVSGDITFYSDTDAVSILDEATGMPMVLFQKKRSLLNASLGTEYYLTRELALRCGFFTNLANSYTVESGRFNQPEHVDLFGGGLSLSYFIRGSSLTLGTVYSYGTGKAQIHADAPYIQNARISSLVLFIGASYIF
ncbi:MAG: OmpP1/FadL family transporter [bacterium]